MTKVSVIIPLHNCEQYVAQTIESVLDQQGVTCEIIVTDDGSKDGGPAIVQQFVERTKAKPNRGTVTLIQQPSSGVSKARNVAIERATGEYIAFVDADDVFMPDKTRKQLALLNAHPEAAGAFCDLFKFENDFDDMGREGIQQVVDDPDVAHIIRYQSVVVSTAMVRREALGDIRFDESTGHGEDSIFAADVRLAGPWRMVKEPLVAKRTRATQATALKWHTVWNIETRVKWCHARRERIGTELAVELENELWTALVGMLEKLYWTRDIDRLKEMMPRVAQMCPEQFGKSFLASKKLYPAWVYRLRDKLPGGR